MDDDTLEILQFIYMAATAATFFFLTLDVSVRKVILGEVPDMIPRKECAVQLTCMK